MEVQGGNYSIQPTFIERKSTRVVGLNDESARRAPLADLLATIRRGALRIAGA